MSWIKNSINTLKAYFDIKNTIRSHTAAADCATDDLSKLKVIELKAMAKAKGFKGYTALKKAQLVDLLKQR
jgi:hypothetical protein